MDDFPVRLMTTKQVSVYNENDTTSRMMEYRFKLGAHGWFVERVPLDPFDPNEIRRRVEALRQHLQFLPQ